MKKTNIKYDVFLGAPPGAEGSAAKVEKVLKDHGLAFFNPSRAPGDEVITEASRRALAASRALVIVAGRPRKADPFSALLGLGHGPLSNAEDRQIGAEMGILIGAGLALEKPTYVLVDDPANVRRADFPREVWLLPTADAENVARNVRSMKLSSRNGGRGSRGPGRATSAHRRSPAGASA